MFGLHAADLVVLGAYLIGVLAIGVWTARRVKTSADFFMPRRYGKLMMMMYGFGAGTHSDQAVGVASKTYSSGLSGIWYQWLWLFCTPFYWLIAPVMRRCRAITTGDIFEARYNRSVSMLYAVLGMLNLSINIGVMLKGSGAVISASTRGELSGNTAIWLMTIIFVLYGVAGGLSAAIITDFIQGMLTIVFSFLLLPLILGAVGGMDGIRAGLDGPGKLSLVAPEEIGAFYIAVIAINGLVGIVTQPHTLSNCAAGKTEYEGRFGWMFGNMLKRVCTIPWCLTGLAAVVYFGAAGRVVEPDHVFGAVAGDFLPEILPGILGLFIAALLASVMSSCDAFMIASSGLFTENLYRPLVPDREPGHYVTVGRIAAVLVVAGGVYCAFNLSGVVSGLEVFWKISAMMGIAFWLGLFWRRTTVAGAWAATLVAFAVMLLTDKVSFGRVVVWDFNALFAQQLPEFMRFEGKLYLPWQMTFYLAAGLLSGIVVSLLTKPVNEQKLEHFYALIRTPVTPGEQVDAPCTLPVGATVPARRPLLPHANLELMAPSRTSVVGFLVGWICVAALIYTVFLIARP
jgi:Na+/proline symporter